MVRISVDNETCELGIAPNTKVGELLETIVSSLPPNRIVSGISLNGQAILKQNELELMGHDLSNVNEVSIQTADKDKWAASGLDMALNCIDRLQKSLILTAEYFRENQLVLANRYFIRCADGLERFVETILLTRRALKLNFDQILTDGSSLSQIERDFSHVLSSIHHCQGKTDYEGIADKIEYELLPNLGTWAKALRQLQRLSFSNA